MYAIKEFTISMHRVYNINSQSPGHRELFRFLQLISPRHVIRAHLYYTYIVRTAITFSNENHIRDNLIRNTVTRTVILYISYRDSKNHVTVIYFIYCNYIAYAIYFEIYPRSIKNIYLRKIHFFPSKRSHAWNASFICVYVYVCTSMNMYIQSSGTIAHLLSSVNSPTNSEPVPL